jgi:hypothetical protein
MQQMNLAEIVMQTITYVPFQLHITTCSMKLHYLGKPMINTLIGMAVKQHSHQTQRVARLIGPLIHGQAVGVRSELLEMMVMVKKH